MNAWLPQPDSVCSLIVLLERPSLYDVSQGLAFYSLNRPRITHEAVQPSIGQWRSRECKDTGRGSSWRYTGLEDDYGLDPHFLLYRIFLFIFSSMIIFFLIWVGLTNFSSISSLCSCSR